MRCLIRSRCVSSQASTWAASRCRTRPRSASSATCWSGTIWGRRFVLPEALAGQFDAICVVDKMIEDGVGNGWGADDFIPLADRHLAGDDARRGEGGVPQHAGASVLAVRP